MKRLSNPFENPYVPKKIPGLSSFVLPQDLLRLKMQLAKLKSMGWPNAFNQEHWENEIQRREMVEMLRLIEIALDKAGFDPKKFSIDFNNGKIVPIDPRILKSSQTGKLN